MISEALSASANPADRRLGLDIERFVSGRRLDRRVRREETKTRPEPQRDFGRDR